MGHIYFNRSILRDSLSEKQKKPTIKIERKVVKASVLKGNPDTIEYKMERLLSIAKLDDPNGAKRQNYLQKEQFNLRDYWYKYLDLRAKLALNNTPTNREEAVLHLMCDELLSRLDNLDVEATDSVKKEFIVTNLKPLLHDIVEIMDGIKPTGSIDINAYQLLQGAKYEQLEREPVLLQK